MSVHLAFDAMMGSVVGSALQPGGFRQQDGAFLCAEGSNLLIIEPQKSVKSTAEQILFTFNFKVISARLARVVDACLPVRATCPIPHWRQRLGGLLPQPADHWWSFTRDVPDGAVPALVDLGVPAVKAVATDESLRELWLTGRAPGLSELQRRIYLSTLLALIGPSDRLASYVALLKAVESNDPTRERVDRHLRLLASLPQL